MSLSGWRPFCMSGSSWEAFLDVREALPVVRVWSGGPPGYPGVVGRPSLMSGSGLEVQPYVR